MSSAQRRGLIGSLRLRRVPVGIVRGLLAVVDATPWLRSRAHRRALSAAHSSQCPLFVCYGNLNRSAVAAALARRRWDRREILEAGHHAIPGTSSLDIAVEAARDFGVDLSHHASTPLSPEALAMADAVFVFDARDLIIVAGRLRAGAGKLHLVGALNPRGPLQVLDPHGREESAYRETFGQIARAINANE